MKNLTLLLILVSYSSFAGLESPFDSTVKGITIKNTHTVGTKGKIYRGMAPLGKIKELSNFGITDILIFKNQTKNEIDQELAEIADVFNPNISQFDFFWHKYTSYKKACEQTIDALKLIKEVSMSVDRKMFFHCTVGEDRTGHLAGLWRILSQNWTIEKAFQDELCERGYEHGNGNKPSFVVNEIRRDLTPLFLSMANLIKDKKITLDNLDYSFCKKRLKKYPKKKCNISSKFKKK